LKLKNLVVIYPDVIEKDRDGSQVHRNQNVQVGGYVNFKRPEVIVPKVTHNKTFKTKTF